MTADILRDKFLAFFKAKNHKIIDSDSLVPKDDPTVLFTPAGMNQFKREFMGVDSGFRRATTCQRCLRTDDLDKVGITSAHHTFFEMLGNFSFGDYFKPEAIAWAWEFLTKELRLDEDRLWVSVYQDDEEAYKIWKDVIGIPEKKIVKLGDKDNFWPAEAKTKGPNGPCGPCSEIFYDFGAEVGCREKKCDPSCSCGRFVEIWNLVFTQFNRKDDGSLVPLPNKNIDTGMGLERLTAVMQGKQNNFETELFQPVINQIQLSAKVKPKDNRRFLYALSDHLRAAVFSIYDGILPSNDGRGYIVRKIIRKSVLHLKSLGINEPFLNKLVGTLAQIMYKPYPDLKDRQEAIAEVILNEEVNFIKVLECSAEIIEDNQKPVLDSIMKDLLNQPKDRDGLIAVSAATCSAVAVSIVHNYETYGIPLSLSTKHFLELIKEKGLKNDNPTIISDKVALELDRLREFSREKSKMKGDVFDAKHLGLKLNPTRFVGYQNNFAEAKILAILKDGQEVQEISQEEKIGLVLDQSPFYAESGGQVGDCGKIVSGDNIFEVLDTQKIDNVFLHVGKITSGVLKKSDKVVARINIERRLNIARNHTATHVLQAALRKVLGTHVQQQGSLVSEEKFRFDFTHFKGMTHEEIAQVEEAANRWISENQAVNCNEMVLKEAKQAGALAFFEEKYGENVRVVSIGEISKELCGGTHLDNIGKIGLIKIIKECSVASGIRRIEGVTADFAKQFIKDEEKKLAEESEKQNQIKELKGQEKKRSLEVNNSLQEELPRIIKKAVEIKGVKVVISLEADLDMNALRLLSDKVKEGLGKGIVVLGSQDKEETKAFLVIAATPDLGGLKFDAGSLIRQIAPVVGGSGGGRRDFAQAGGTKPENFTLAFEKLRAIIEAL